MLVEQIKVLMTIFSFLIMILVRFLLIEPTTIRRMRQVQTWLQSKPSMWIHNFAAAEKVL